MKSAGSSSRLDKLIATVPSWSVCICSTRRCERHALGAPIGPSLCIGESSRGLSRPPEELPLEGQGGSEGGMVWHMEAILTNATVDAETLVNGKDVDELDALALRSSAQKSVHPHQLLSLHRFITQHKRRNVSRYIAIGIGRDISSCVTIPQEEAAGEAGPEHDNCRMQPFREALKDDVVAQRVASR